MGIWYLILLIIGVILHIKFTFFCKQYNWRFALSIQLAIIGILIIVFAIFMFLPISNKLVDIIFH